MKKLNYYAIALLAVFALACNNDNDEPPVDPGESGTDLLVKKFTAAPTLDGTVDDMWATAQKLSSNTAVPSNKGNRNTYFNEDGIGEENLDIFEAYEGEKNNFTMRSGTFGDEIFFLIEWDDAEDSKDRQSWYFDPSDKLWKGEHKYANATDDKFYEDKFAFLFPIGEVDDFSNSTCYATCHGPADIAKDKDKHTRHYLKGADQKIDMWHWKRVRGTHNDKIDDQRIQYVAAPYTSSSNGRGGDPNSGDGARSGYSNNSQKLMITGTTIEVSVPMYVMPGATDKNWYSEDDIASDAKLVTEVDDQGVLSYAGGTIDPTGDTGYDQATGDKRFPSILTRDFLGERADLDIKAVHTGTGWVAEVKRKLNTGDPWDVVFDPAVAELPFGFAIFDNAAIAHGIKPGLTLKFEQ